MFPFTEILFKPGSKFSYSNPAIIFLGRIIEKLTGDDYEVYVDKNILKPLEMYRAISTRLRITCSNIARTRTTSETENGPRAGLM